MTNGFYSRLDETWGSGQYGALDSFNGKFRDECLGMEWFLSRVQAKAVIEAWRGHFNEGRPHLSLGYLTPAEFAA